VIKSVVGRVRGIEQKAECFSGGLRYPMSRRLKALGVVLMIPMAESGAEWAARWAVLKEG
jgi:hypothetical protein